LVDAGQKRNIKIDNTIITIIIAKTALSEP
jgi:hypothetical protein